MSPANSDSNYILLGVLALVFVSLVYVISDYMSKKDEIGKLKGDESEGE
jgi:hypothetical protein